MQNIRRTVLQPSFVRFVLGARALPSILERDLGAV
jgi:hypothetical protein